MARPTKLTPETQAEICRALEMGATFELAAQFGGVSYASFNEWRKRGEAELARREGNVKPGTRKWETEQPFVQFFEATKKAEARAAIGWLAKIEKAANDGSWQAAAWKLERRYPERYGRKRVDTDITSGGEKLTFEIQYADDTD